MENMTAARESSEGRRDVQGRTRECVGEWELCCQQGRGREPWAEEREPGVLPKGTRVVQSSADKKKYAKGRARAEKTCWDTSPMYPDPTRAQGPPEESWCDGNRRSFFSSEFIQKLLKPL